MGEIAIGAEMDPGVTFMGGDKVGKPDISFSHRNNHESPADSSSTKSNSSSPSSISTTSSSLPAVFTSPSYPSPSSSAPSPSQEVLKRKSIVRAVSVPSCGQVSTLRGDNENQQRLQRSASESASSTVPPTVKYEIPSPPLPRSPLSPGNLNRTSPPKMRLKRSSIRSLEKFKLPSPVKLNNDLFQGQEYPQDLSCSRRTSPPPYPLELQLDLSIRGREKDPSKGGEGKENEIVERGIKRAREDDDDDTGGSSSEFKRLPVTNNSSILGEKLKIHNMLQTKENITLMEVT
ncbi:hypothetical protein SK128_024277 [Halocaridina rubra]|uniref:Uncharacterized protein n=1 Tax=Halocaridina rubra TaxID=373956 RepID=A0AAN9FUR3_HALRR